MLILIPYPVLNKQNEIVEAKERRINVLFLAITVVMLCLCVKLGHAIYFFFVLQTAKQTVNMLVVFISAGN